MAAASVPSSVPVNPKLIEQYFTLTAQANDEFEKGEYDNCLRTLTELEAITGKNHRSRHNRSIVEFYKTNSKDYDKLLAELESLQKLDPEQTTPHLDITKLSVNNVAKLNLIPAYNKAVLYFYKRKYFAAIDTLNPFVKRIFDFDEKTSTMIGTLMLHLLLETRQICRAQGLLNEMHNYIGVSKITVYTDDTTASDSIEDKELSQQFAIMAELTKVLNGKTTALPEDSNLEMAFMRAHQSYRMADFTSSADQLKKIKLDESYAGLHSDLDTIVANNMGIMHFRVKNYTVAAQFFKNAVNFNNIVLLELPTMPLQELGTIHTPEIIYNLGMNFLHMKEPVQAFRCFIIALSTYYNNPRLWFRAAEACIMNHELFEKQNNSFRTSVLFPDKDPNDMNQSILHLKRIFQQLNTVDPSLEFAVFCLRCALMLIDYHRDQWAMSLCNNEEGGEHSWHRINDMNFYNPSMPIKMESLYTLLSSVYAAYSYVCLRMGEYVSAYDLALELSKTENLSGIHRVLSHMYAGEALVMMNRLPEARMHLDPVLATTLHSTAFKDIEWKVQTRAQAGAILRYNLAVSLLLQGDFEASLNVLEACTQNIVAPNKKTLRRYLQSLILQKK